MYTQTNYLLAKQIHEDRQQELLHQVRLDELFAEQRTRRRETMQRLLGLLQPVAWARLTSRTVNQIVTRGV